MGTLFSDDVRDATLSERREYRYKLSRIWNSSQPLVLFVMLNPSTADGMIDDPTIRRCIGFAKSWGYGGLYVGNLFAWRATDPKELLTASEPFGADNQKHLDEMMEKCDLIVAAWGNSPIVKKLMKGRSYDPFKGRSVHYLDLSADGTPKHPLYLKKDLQPQLFEVRPFFENET
jgi:hypothetical protein